MICSCRSLLVLFLLALGLGFEGLVATSASAQVQTGTPPFGSLGGGPDVINLANLNAHLTIPVIHKPGRGTDFTYDLGYDSAVWYPVTSGSTQSWQPDSMWGWGVQTAAAIGYAPGPVVSYGTITCLDDTLHRHTYTYTRYIYTGFRDPLGTFHPYRATLTTGTGLCNADVTEIVGVVKDGSGWTVDFVPTAATATSTSGSVINLAIGSMASSGTITDRNGNQLTTTNGSTFTDTLGQTVLTSSGGAPSPLVLSYTAPSGGTAQYTVKYTTYTVQTNFGCSGITEYGANGTTTASLVSEIDLPDGSKYTFVYEQTPSVPANVTGRLKSVMLPTGGTITYNYTGGSSGHITCSDGSPSGFTRQTPDGTWTYARTPGTGAAYTTTITAPQLSYDTLRTTPSSNFRASTKPSEKSIRVRLPRALFSRRLTLATTEPHLRVQEQLSFSLSRSGR
jgi:hypothetical protein